MQSTFLRVLPQFLLATLAGSLPAQFHDDFTGALVRPEWTWTDPGNDCSYQIGPLVGCMRMTVPPGNDHTTGHAPPLYAGPKLTVPVHGDFTITTHVSVNYPASPAAKESGLMIWKDTSNNLQFKRTNAYNSQNVLLYGNLANPVTSMHGQVNVSANELYLRVVRAGNVFTASFSTNGLAWTQAGSVPWAASLDLEVGLATSYWLWFGTGTAPALGDYQFFDVATPGASFAADRAGVSAIAGGTISFGMTVGASHAGELYLVLGSLTGSEPGFPLPGGAIMPLNYDWFTQIMLNLNNAPGLFPGTLGVLDGAGSAAAAMVVPPALFPPLVGGSFRFAAAFTPFTLYPIQATNAVAVGIL